MEVIIHGSEELARFVAQLVREGLKFNAYPNRNELNVVSYIVTFN